MKPSICYVLAAFAITALAAIPISAQLSNPGFEEPLTSDGPPFVGFWEAFNGGAGSEAINGTTNPRSGTQHLALSITNTDNTFAGVFQDVPNLTPGSAAVFSGWNTTTTTPLGLAPEVRIEWRNSTTNQEISRTPNLVPTLTGQYTPFTLSAVVPAGADTARVVYAIQSFGPEPTNNGVVFVDDVSFVPEPATALLAVLGGLGLACTRRRRA